MNRFYLLLLTLLLTVGNAFSAKEKSGGLYLSPDKNVSLRLMNFKGQYFFKVMYGGRVVVEKSPLGLETSLGSFSEELKQTGKVTEQLKRESYVQPIGKKSHVSIKYREVRVPIKNAESKQLDLIFRISNDGVAYCYKLYGSGPCTINRELGGFRFPGSAKAFMTPLSVAHSGWARANPSYPCWNTFDPWCRMDVSCFVQDSRRRLGDGERNRYDRHVLRNAFGSFVHGQPL